MTEKIKELLKKYRFFGWPLWSIIVSLLLLFFLVMPQIFAYLDTNKLINDTEQRAIALNTKAKTLASINTDGYQSNLDLALTVLPENRDIPTTIGQIQTLVGQSGMQLGTVGVTGADNASVGGSSDSSSGAQSYDVKIDVIGSIDQLNALFEALNNGPEIMKLNGMDLSVSGKGLVDANLNIITYFQGPPAVLGDIEKPIEGLTKDEIDSLTKIQKQVSPATITSTSVNLPPRGKTDPFQ